MKANTKKIAKQKASKQARLNLIAPLYKRGKSFRQMREILMEELDLPTLSIGTISRDVKTLLDEWRGERIEDIGDAMELDLRRIDEMICELWDAWERSKEEKSKHQKEKVGLPKKEGNGQKSVNEIVTAVIKMKDMSQDMTGDVRYLQEIGKCIDRRQKILGYGQPNRHEVTGKDGKAVELNLVGNMNREDLEKELAELQAKHTDD